MKKIIIFAVIVCLLLCFTTSNTIYSTAENIKIDNKMLNSSAKSMVVMETTNNNILYSKNEDIKLPMASTTKIVTALTVIENCEDLNKLIVIPKKATLVEGSSIYLRENEELTIEQLLYGLMLQSGNDAAVALALEVGNGNIEDFANKMNEVALKCGATNSHFVTPHGLDHNEHYTTASDLAKITSYALKNPVFKQIVSTKVYKIEQKDNCTARTLINKNKLLNSLEGCIGVKTGYTSKAGRCLVSACERDRMQVVCVVLNCRPMFEESADLINKAFNEYGFYEVLLPYKFVTDVVVEEGETSSLRLYNKKGYSVVCKKDEVDKYSIIYNYSKTVKAPIEKDKVLGNVEIYLDKTLIFSEDLCSIEGVRGISSDDKIKNILDKW